MFNLPIYLYSRKKSSAYSVFGVFPALDGDEADRYASLYSSLHSPAHSPDSRESSIHERPRWHAFMTHKLRHNRSVGQKGIDRTFACWAVRCVSRDQMDHFRLSSMIIFYNPISWQIEKSLIDQKYRSWWQTRCQCY